MQRARTTVDQVADEPELVSIGREADSLQQFLEFVAAALDVANGPARHLNATCQAWPVETPESVRQTQRRHHRPSDSCPAWYPQGFPAPLRSNSESLARASDTVVRRPRLRPALPAPGRWRR